MDNFGEMATHVSNRTGEDDTTLMHTLIFSQADAAPAAGTIAVYDGTDATGTLLYTEIFTTDVFRAYSVLLDIAFTAGPFIKFTTTADVSVTASYR